jgi:CPA2 family monovalent cation:H+ antiporter-2
MTHLPEIIRDLGVILITASVVCLVFARLKLPLVLGYLLSGFLLSPTISFFPNVLDTKTVQTWAEIGIIFMMFNLGIEFSFRRLNQLGSQILIVGFLQVAFMFLLGYKLGDFFGMSNLGSLFMGSMLCICSTAVIIKAFEEYSLKAKQFAQVTIGILVFEDLAAMLLLVFLTTLGRTQEIQGTELILTTIKLLFYLAVWLTVGLFAIPSIVRYAEKYLTDEIALVVSVGLCFGMVALSVQSGFSPALGAFVMGSILAETAQKDRIEKLLHPIKDLFSAIFFVSIGLLVKPGIFLEEPLMIGIACLAIIFGNLFSVTVGGVLSGLSLRNSIFSGLSLSQIGEFSFIIAGLGISLKALNEKYLSIIVAVAVVTTLITPFLISRREKIADLIESRIPQNLKNSIQQYSIFSESIGGHKKWQTILRDFLVRVLINATVVVALFIIVSKYIAPSISRSIKNGYIAELTILLLALVVSAPFFWGMVFSKSQDPEFRLLYRELIHKPGRKFLFYLRVVLAMILCFFLISYALSMRVSLLVFVLIIVAYSLFLRRFMGSVYQWFEQSFQAGKESNSPKEPLEADAEAEKNRENKMLSAQLVPWDQHLQDVEVSPNCRYIGKTLEQLQLRERSGVNIALIKRGIRSIPAPNKDEVLYPYDRIFVVGDDRAIESFLRDISEKEDLSSSDQLMGEISLVQHVVIEGSHLLGKTIRHSGIREKTQALVIGVERQGQRILSPDSQLEIQMGDQLWLVGNRTEIQKFL